MISEWRLPAQLIKLIEVIPLFISIITPLDRNAEDASTTRTLVISSRL